MCEGGLLRKPPLKCAYVNSARNYIFMRDTSLRALNVVQCVRPHRSSVATVQGRIPREGSARITRTGLRARLMCGGPYTHGENSDFHLFPVQSGYLELQKLEFLLIFGRFGIGLVYGLCGPSRVIQALYPR